MTPHSDKQYWFPAKRYGWGWGIPRTWQGWAVLGGYCVLLFGGIPLIRTSMGAMACLAYGLALTAVLVAVCWFKGEPPRWRWGERDG